MKNETAIRQHIADLQWANVQPCTCRTPDEKEACRIGRLIMTSAIGSLAWVLEDHPDYEEVVRALFQMHKASEGLPCHRNSPPIPKES